MKAITQEEILALVSAINLFADQAENLIKKTKSNYERDKGNLINQHEKKISDLEAQHKLQVGRIKKKADGTVNEAINILNEIIRLDQELSAIDKYYLKTKNKKEELLATTTSEQYVEATDYFKALEDIKKSFEMLYQRYTTDILPGLINGLNYLFSSQRKKDYEELIVLRNTVLSFVDDIKVELPEITNETLTSMREEYQKQRKVMCEVKKKEIDLFEEKYLITLDQISNQIYDKLDQILPDEFVEYLRDIIKRYEESDGKVNTSNHIQDGILNMVFVSYKVDYFVESAIVASIIKEKCSDILVDDCICLPICMSIHNSPTWMILNDNTNQKVVQELTHSIMYGMLSCVPVAKIKYSVIDPENRGNNIAPFFEAKKKLPELFDNQIIIDREDITEKLRELNDIIGETLQNRLGNQYETIFDYAKDHEDYDIKLELFVLYDFPKGFDERAISELRNIIRNGSKCGIYLLISYLPDPNVNYSCEYVNNLDEIRGMTVNLIQQNQGFILGGLPLQWFEMPKNIEFAKFFSKYMLIYEGMKNRGIAFSPLIRRLNESKDLIEIESHIDYIYNLMKHYEEEYASVPDIKAIFPASIILGSVMYPADIFSDSMGFEQIMKRFGYGEYSDEQLGFVELPLIFDLENTFNLFLKCMETNAKQILAFTHHVMWTFLTFLPITKVNICVFDSEQRGNSIIPFLDFRKKSADTFDEKIYTNSDDMINRLQKMNRQIDEFIQEKLGNKYKNILQYNQNAPNRSESVTLLILYDFPSGMDGRAMDLLLNILRNGNKCGVYTIICHNPNVNYSRYDNVDERIEKLMNYCAVIDYKDNSYRLQPFNLKIRVPEILSNDQIEDFIENYVANSEKIRKQGLSFKDIVAKDMFSGSSAKMLSIPVGVGDGESIINIVIGEGSSHHGLIAGATGSGKSTLLHTLIMSSMLHYSPEELHLYLMDFKSGTEFKIYESVRLPHIQLLALDAMQEFGESILENLITEMEHRANAFKEADGVTKIKDYVKVSGNPMPRILVIMDEFQILFNDSTNRKVAMHCAELAKRIVTEGRAFGIHLLMATQSTKVITDLTLSHGTIEQMRIRVGLKCGEYDARYLFSDQNDAKALALMKGPIGTAVLNEDYTEEPNVAFRVAYCDDDTQNKYLHLIEDTFADKPYTMQTFEGNRTIELLDYFRQVGIGYTDELPIKIHMGTLIKVAPPFEITIDKKKKHNMLVCGANERMLNLVVNNYIISALLNRNANVYCIDGDCLVGDNTSFEFYEAMSIVNNRFHLASDRGDIITIIREVYDKFIEWKKENSNEVVFVVIKNIQFLDIVKSMLKGEMIDDGDFLDEEPELQMNPEDPFAAINNMFANKKEEDTLSTGEKLIKLIEEGSGFGVHFVVSAMDYQTVRETMYYGENVLSKFPERVIFSLGDNDSENLIENVVVSGLRDSIVYYTDGVKNTFQLKPYVFSDMREVTKFMQEKI